MGTKFYSGAVDYWRAFGDYTVTTTNTEVTITLDGGFASIARGFDIGYIDCTVTVDGKSAKTTNNNFYSANGDTIEKSMASVSKTITRGTTSKTVTLKVVTYNHSGWRNGTGTATTTVTIPALTSYSVKYNNNGGTGAPAAQTKYYGQSLVLSTAKPTKSSTTASAINTTFNTNFPATATDAPNTTTSTVTPTISYSFKNWNTKTNGTGTAYSSGATYTTNAALDLYAQWNSTTSTPSIVAKTLSYPNYTFNGWTATNSSTIIYTPGKTFTPTTTTTLYGSWTLNYINPRITSISSIRCDENREEQEDGTYCLTTVTWENGDDSITSISLQAQKNNSTATISKTVNNITGTSITVFWGEPSSSSTTVGKFDTESRWNITATIQGTNTASYTDFLSPAFFTMDILKGGHGISMGAAASLIDTLAIYFAQGVTFPVNSGKWVLKPDSSGNLSIEWGT